MSTEDNLLNLEPILKRFHKQLLHFFIALKYSKKTPYFHRRLHTAKVILPVSFAF